MKQSLLAGPPLMVCMLFGTALAIAQESGQTLKPISHPIASATIVIPKSSRPASTNGTTLKTLTAHTHTQLYLPSGWKPDQVTPPRPAELPPYPGYAYETPASLACLYSLVKPTPGCNPNVVTTNVSGGSKSIAIVDAYDDPWAGPDLAYFSALFGLPFKPEKFQVVYQDGPSAPPAIDGSGGWEFEESLDIEYSHAMAPNATIYLVETDSNSYADLLTGVQIANNLVSCGNAYSCPTGSAGRGEVSMSWGGPEFPEETSADSAFTTPGVVYFAAAGDEAGTDWPCVSPNVVCAGGTTIRRNPYSGDYVQERSWELGAGGASLYEPIPFYQSSISDIVGAARGVPDVALDSNPITGAWVWDSNYFEELGGGWFIAGGTSMATPTWAGIVNVAGTFHSTSAGELAEIYENRTDAAKYHDVRSGDCGPYAGFLAVPGWDPCTGVGSARGYGGK